ncbi:MAG: helix-turn-helix transcriptional regulator [Cytophagales bacterium]|nr:helix-turn-helix transcriptional regulator [Cytophagales bacterium]
MINVKKKMEDDRLVKASMMKRVIKPTQPHKHDGYHELIFLSRGSGTHTIDDHVFEVRPTVGFYLKPGQVHCWDFSQVPEGFVILFKEQFMDSYSSTLSRLFMVPGIFDHQEDPSLLLQVEEFYKAYKSHQQQEVLDAHLNLILLKMLNLKNHALTADSSSATVFYQFKTLVNENYLDLRNVSAYADLMNLSIHRLNAICQKNVQTSALSIIKERVLIEAKNLVTHTSLSISEIAYRLNFSDPSNFVKFFKSLTTLTPLQYRSELH